jgi:3-hydroxybutyryl-CoA dehydrogenase
VGIKLLKGGSDSTICQKVKMEKNWNILIVGAGTMGRGIAEVFSAKGINTTLYDAYPEQLEKAKKLIKTDMHYMKEEGLVIEEEVKNTQNLIFYEEDLKKCAPNANLVIEGIFEDADAKHDIFNQLDQLCTADCLFLSNTSASNIFEIAQISHPERLLITHFFNPPYIMPLVEIVMGPKTSPETLDIVKKLLIKVGKDPAVIKQYIPGFIVNRIATAIAREAGYMITQGWTTGADIDRAIRNTSGIRYAFEGPMALYDVVGWDLTTKVSKDIHKSLCNDNNMENRLGEELVEKGDLGLKSGKGVYDYTDVNTQEYMNKRSHKIIKMIKTMRTLND